ncbi:NUDIX hydrolase [Planobispora rosea]|uniref:NUDIX hydrolase n=1 Tax=Planobispora rosea TaxID=35762 RepID=UPI003140A2B7
MDTSGRTPQGTTPADGDFGMPGSLARVLAEIGAERAAQDARWGIQDIPDGTGPEGAAAAGRAKDETAAASADGTLTWRHILIEEVLEAFAENDPEALRTELIQVAAVAAKWAQALDRRTSRPGRKDRFRAVVDVHVLLVRDGEVLLMRRAGTGYGDGRWHLPSGHLEAGESAVHAAVREAREETGVAIAPEDLAFVHVMHRAPERVGLFFLARNWDGEPYNAEPGKCSEIAWCPLDALPPDTIDYPAAAVRAITAGQPFALHGWDPAGDAEHREPAR